MELIHEEEMKYSTKKEIWKGSVFMDNQTYNSDNELYMGNGRRLSARQYVQENIRDVILPMTVIRRLDAVLEETKPAVLEMKKKLDEAGIM